MKNTKRILSILMAVLSVINILLISVAPVGAATAKNPWSSYSEPTRAVYYTNPVMKGNDVKWIQTALNTCIAKKLIKTTDLSVDGSFGPACKSATKLFQKAVGCTQDGSFGPATRSKIVSYLNSIGYSKPKAQTTTTNGLSGWLWPTTLKRTSCGFADNYYHTDHWHRGIDIPVSNKTNVYASKSGKVALIYNKGTGARGNYVVIDHGDGYYSEYQHLSSIDVKLNATVSQGQVIAKSGNTGVGGYHLHFEIMNLGKSGLGSSYMSYYNSYSKYVNVNPKNEKSVYCTSSNSSFKIRQASGNGIPKANLVKSSISAGSGAVYCSDSNGINYSFK